MILAADIFEASILIVDDQQTNVDLLEKMLREAGYLHITTTTDPLVVCNMHRDNHYDLILLDLKMPIMNGFEVMECLKEVETTGYIPILVITAQPGNNLRALDSGAKDFISKPFDLREAKTRIYNMLEVRLLYKQLELKNSELESLAMHDSLTGLPNRRLLTDRLSLAIAHARRNKSAMAVMYLDLDGFKQINDTLGHDAGDTLLSMVATRLMSAVREEDTVARLGGDEFAVVLWDLKSDYDLSMLASKIIQSVSLPFSIQGSDLSITTSVGISIYPTHGENVETLIKQADLALHEAKCSGKNDYRIAVNSQLLKAADS